MKRFVVLLTKGSQNAVLSPFFARLQESVPPKPTSPCKISSQSVPVGWSYFRKVISYDRNICLRHIINCPNVNVHRIVQLYRVESYNIPDTCLYDEQSIGGVR